MRSLTNHGLEGELSVNERDKLLLRIQMTNFAALEIHLFLDTHPNNTEAIQLYDKYTREYEALVKEFESKYGPINYGTVTRNNKWEWIKNPWPWD